MIGGGSSKENEPFFFEGAIVLRKKGGCIFCLLLKSLIKLKRDFLNKIS